MGPESPSEWVVRWAPLVKSGPVLDVASGPGRHARLFAARGFEAVAVDRAPQQITGVKFVQADLENGNPWPFAGQRFGAIVVTNYLHRPLFKSIEDSLGEGGVLIYETFMIGNERFGKPSNPAFLLRDGELLDVARDGGLSVVAYEATMRSDPGPAMVQRLAARRP